MKILSNTKHSLFQYAIVLSLSISLLNSCEYNVLEPPFDCGTSGLVIEVVSSANTNCGLSNGSVALSAVGVAPPFVFSLAGISQASGLFEGLEAGNYTASVKDANGCTNEVAVSITNTNGVGIGSIDVQGTACGSNTGAIAVTAVGGTPPYSYSIDGTSFQQNNVFSGLAKGAKEVTVRDASNCEFSQQVTITSGVSFKADISPIIQNSCAVSGCHNGSRAPDLRTFSNIQSNASRIQSRTGNRSMPQGSSLSQQQIDNIACWVEDGAPNN